MSDHKLNISPFAGKSNHVMMKTISRETLFKIKNPQRLSLRGVHYKYSGNGDYLRNQIKI